VTAGEIGVQPDVDPVDVRPFRLGFLSHLHGDAEPQRHYREYVELFVAADQLGFDTAWVAQHHFSPTAGRLPSPFPFLAAVAERTHHLRLGTAVITLGLEDPIRIAEDAAVLDALSGGRFELGIGGGGDPSLFAAFGKEVEGRRERNTAAVSAMVRAFRGELIPGTEHFLHPPAPGLDERIWQAATSADGAAFVGRLGNRLLLNRAQFNSDRRTDEVQLPWAEAYLGAYRGASEGRRIGLSRGVYPAKDKAAARSVIESAVLKLAEQRVARNGGALAGLTPEEYFERLHISYGSPDDVAERLASDRVLPLATDLICQFSPAAPPLQEGIAVLELIATEVAPKLGWSPAR